MASWLWPDHVISKGESRRLRDEHNKLVNAHASLTHILAKLVNVAELGISIHPDSPLWAEARAVLTKPIQ